MPGGICRGRAGGKIEEAAPKQVALSEAEKQKAKEIFELYDYDGSGTIDMTELRELLLELRLNVSPEFLEDYTHTIFSNLDLDKSKKISFEEFEKLYKEVIANQPTGVRKQNTRERVTVGDAHNVDFMLRQAFEAYDADGSGYLDTPEMLTLLLDLGFPDPHGDGFQSVLAEHMEFADLDSDGRVDFHEFVLYSNALLDYLYQMENDETASEQSAKRRY